MNSIFNLFPLLFLAAISNLSDARIDSIGIEFVTLFPLNYGQDVKANTVNVLEFLNADENSNATVQISYIQFVPRILRSQTVYDEIIVASQSALKYPLQGNVMYEGIISPGVNKVHDARIYIKSSIPITVLQHSYVTNSSGDSFTVLPTKMAGKYFSFSTATAVMNTSETLIFILPLVTKTNVEITTISSSNRNPNSTVMTALSGRYMTVFKVEYEGSTLHIRSDDDVNLIVAMRVLVELNSTDADGFGIFMPSSIPQIDCSTIISDDDHFANIPYESEFSIAAPFMDCSPLKVEVSSEYGQIEVIDVDPKEAQQAIQFEQNYGETVRFHAVKTVIQVLRFGDGAYVDSLPSLSQFVSGPAMFSVPTEANEVAIFGDKVTAKTARLDDKRICMMEIDDGKAQIYYGSKTLTEGVHSFTANGTYSIMISGMNGLSSYGFVPLLNKIAITTSLPTTPTASPLTTETIPHNVTAEPITTTTLEISTTTSGLSTKTSGLSTTTSVITTTPSSSSSHFNLLFSMLTFFITFNWIQN